MLREQQDPKSEFFVLDRLHCPLEQLHYLLTHFSVSNQRVTGTRGQLQTLRELTLSL